MLNWLKWKIASKELAELERWRVQWYQHRRWFAEFKDAAAVLDNLQQEAISGDPLPVSVLRERIRRATQRTQAQEGQQQ